MTSNLPQRALLVFIGLALAYSAFTISFSMPLYLDEFTYAHAAWLISQGQVPYRDFALFHPPLVEILLAPVFLITDSTATAVLLLRAVITLIVLCSFVAIEKMSAVLPGLITCLGLISGLYSTYIFQIRPDSVALALVLFSGFFMLRKYPVAAGIFLALGCFASEKAVIYGLAIIFASSAENRARLLLSAASTGTCLYGALIVVCGFEPVWHFLIEWTVVHVREYPRISVFSQLYSQAYQLCVLGGLALVGLITYRSQDRRLWSAMLFLGAAAYLLQNAAFAYSALPLLPPLLIFAARGICRLQAVAESRAVGQGVVVLLTFLAVSLADRTEAETLSQRHLFAEIDRVVPKDAIVYDNTGMAITRPHAVFYFFSDAKIRSSMGAQIETEIPELLAARQCAAMVLDQRFFTFSSEFQSKLRLFFPHCSGLLCVSSRLADKSISG